MEILNFMQRRLISSHPWKLIYASFKCLVCLPRDSEGQFFLLSSFVYFFHSFNKYTQSSVSYLMEAQHCCKANRQ